MHTYCRAAAALLFITIGAGYAATKPAPVPAHAPVRAAHPTAPDAEVEKAIRARFAASKISTHHFQVHVQGGVATIEGQTDVLQHKGVATRLAKSAGATTVVNRVAVSQAAKDKAAKNLASGRRRAQIKRSDTTKRTEKRSL
jgi:hypothetical protein